MKYFLIAIAAFAYLFGSVWLFNHVNPWIGLIAILLFAGILIWKAETIIKKVI